MVPVTGLEPVQCLHRRIFLLLYVTIATLLCCSLDHVFTISIDLGGWYMISTHLRYYYRFSSAFSQSFTELANFYTKSFLLGTLCFLSSRSKVRCVCLFHHTGMFSQDTKKSTFLNPKLSVKSLINFCCMCLYFLLHIYYIIFFYKNQFKIFYLKDMQYID